MENIETFLDDFNHAQTVEEKSKILEYLLSDSDISDDDIKELQAQINDIVENNVIEQDAIISMEIEDGLYQLYTCIQTNSEYKSGSNYYVKVDDPKEFYLSTGIGETNPIIQNMIDSIKPIYWIVTDDGIGTLKRKNIFSKDLLFSDYFTKFA